MDPTAEHLLAHSAWLHELVRSMVADRDLAADVAQDTLLVAWRRRLQGIEDVRGWLATVARNLVRRASRQGQRRRVVEALAPMPEPAPDTADVIARASAQRDVFDAVLRLREPYRTTLLLRYQEDLGYAELAERLGVDMETVRTRIKRGLRQLRQRLDAQHGDSEAWAVPILGVTGYQQATAAAAPGAAASAAGGSIAAAGVLVMSVKSWLLAPIGALLLVLLPLVLWPDSEVIDPPAERSVVAGAVAAAERTAAPEGASRIERIVAEAAATPAAVGADGAQWILTGQVVDAAMRQFVVDAAITITEQLNILVPRPPVLAQAATGADGSFRVAVPRPAMGDLSLRVTHAGFAWSHRSSSGMRFQDLADGVRVLDFGHIELVRGASLGGRVVDADGAPVPHAAVHYYRAAAGQPIAVLTASEPIGSTDGDGRFVLPGRFAKEQQPQWLFAVGATSVGWRKLDVAATDFDVRDLDIVLRPTESLAVRVQDGTGKPVPQARVIAWPRYWPISSLLDVSQGNFLPELGAGLFMATTDESGLANLKSLPVGEDAGPLTGAPAADAYRIRIFAEGVRAQEHLVELGAVGGELQVMLGRGQRVDVLGEVVGPIGQPIAGATVELFRDRTLTTTTGADGRFTIPAVDVANGSVSWRVSAPGFATRMERTDCSGLSGDVTLRVQLALEASIRGIVVDETDVPIEGASVWFFGHIATTKADGRFHFPVAADASGTLLVNAPKAGGPFEAMVMVAATPGEHRVVLRRLGRPVATLRLALRDAATGRPVEPLHAFLGNVDDVMLSHTLQLSGAGVEAEGLVPGRWRVSVSTRDGHFGSRTFVVEDRPTVIDEPWELHLAARAEVQLDRSALPADSTPGQLVVELLPRGAGRLHATATPAEGDSDRLVLPPGTTRLFVSQLQAHAPLRLRVQGQQVHGAVAFTVAAGEQRELQVRLQAGCTVQIRSSPIPNLRSACIAFETDGAFADEHWLPLAETAVTGTLTLPPGSFRYRIRVDTWGSPVREIGGTVAVGLQREAVIQVQ